MTQEATQAAAEGDNDLQQLKAVYALASNKLKRLDSPQQELQQICEVLKEAVATNRMGTDPEFQKFVNNELAIGLLQKMAKTTSFDANYVNTCADMMEVFMDMFAMELKNKRFSEQFTCAMTWCFQPETTLHKRNFQLSDDDLKKLSTSRQMWRAELKAGDMIDVNAIGDDKEKTKGWVQARIERAEGEILSLVFPDLTTDFDTDVPRWSTDIAQFESHTKADYAWRRENIRADSIDFLVDCHDNFKWEEATIFNVYPQTSGGREILMGNIGFRVYRDYGKKMREDARGKFDGWSNKYDEDIPIFSPRVQGHLSRVNKGVQDLDDDVDEDLDDLIPPEPGHSRVYGVPRISSCISSKFIYFINRFGNNGGFQALLDALASESTTSDLTLTTMGYMITMISMPSKLYHKDWLADNALPFTQAMRKQLLEAPDKILKDVTANDVSQIQISINTINGRVMDREASKVESEKLKLEICKKCLSSELLERRILGIKELNNIIRSTQQITYGAAKSTNTLEWLINWMNEHGVFDILWDTKKTHLQLVQRSNEIFKVLPKENLLSMELLEQFWMLSKSDYKSEVFKIINEAAFHLRQEHIEYLFDEITKTPANKLGMEEFDALQNMGKFSRSTEFQTKTSEFFWGIITDSDQHKADLIENCINKFSDMIKYSSMEKKQPYFNNLVSQLQTGKSAVPVIRLFKKIIKDQKAKMAYSSTTTSSTYGSSATGGTTVINHGASSTVDGKIVYSRSYQGSGGQGQADAESIYPAGTASTTPANGAAEEEEKTEEVTLRSVLNALHQQQGFVEALLNNLGAYCQESGVKIAANPGLAQEADRMKIFLVNPKHSHQDEVNERLSFLQEFAMNSDFKISKAQLKVIYDLLTKSPIQSDFNEFLTWCNTACSAQTATMSVLDLDEVGEFFSELINNESLNLAALPVVGFEFLKMYFTSQNLEQQKLLKVSPPEKKKPAGAGTSWNTNTYYGSMNDKKDDAIVPQDDDPTFKVAVEPSQLTKIDMVWQIALQSQVEEVISKSIAFLVNCYLSVHDVLEDRRNEILQSLNSRCFELIKSSQDKPAQIKRIVRILESVIKISEKKGTGGVQPHNAILKGEMLDRIIIRYMVKNKQYYYGGLKLDRSIVVQLFTSATVWEFKKEVSQMLGLAPKYVKLTLPNKSVLRDNQHGMTLHELSLKNGDILTAEKLSIAEEVTEVDLIDRATRSLVPRAREIFTEWYGVYKDPESDAMDAKNVAAFIAGATKQPCNKDDSRVDSIMNKFDSDKDGRLTLDDFLNFYYDAASGAALKAVQQNLKNHNVRLDLKKMSEVVEQIDYAKNEMPRHTLSANQEQFQALFSLLDRNDETSEDVWNLVRMLATNDQMYQEVLSLSTAKQADGSINWAKVFEDPSLYKQIYKQEIIVAVMEATKAQEQGKRVMFVEEQIIASSNTATKVGQAGAEPDEEEKKAEEQSSEADAESKKIEQLKAAWTQQFLEKQGFSFVLSHFLARQVTSRDATTFSEQASLKDVAFLMTLLNVFLQAGFQSQQGAIGDAMRFIRRESGADASQGGDASMGAFAQLMLGQAGQSIMQGTDFEQLFDKLVQIIASSLSKSSVILEDKIIIQNAVTMVVGIMMAKPALYTKFVNFQAAGQPIANTEQLILAGLLCPEEKIRSDIARALQGLAMYLSSQDCNPLHFVLGLQARNFASISNKPSRQFFELFNELIDLKAHRDTLAGEAAADSSAIYDPEDLLNQIIDKIKAQQKLKQEASAQQVEETEEDEVKALELAAEQERLLVGLITLTGKIIAKADKAVSDRIIQEKDLIGQIFKEFLFASYYQAQMENANSDAIVIYQQKGSRNDKKKVAAPNNKSREAAYELLHQLIKNSTALMKTFLDENLSPLISTIKKPKGWNYVPQVQQSERSQQYVGLRNLGCICYMNSMMQQFFMIPALRYNLLCVDDGKPEDIKEYKGEKIDDSMMHQLQKMIAHLELSERTEFNPMQFCFAFKEFDGAPTNTAEQKDAQEFLNLIFDRLETALKDTSRKHLVNGIFGGKQCSQMVCTECGKVKNRMEDYLNLSLPVKGIKSVEESLQKQVEGEIINDYQCDGCNRKVDLKKRTMIASTPNILIVHLQRICFNFDTFQNDKVNTFCSFPNVLDLEPYCFHEVMGKENRLQSQQEEEEAGLSNQVQKKDEELTEEELANKREAEQDAREPERDDCYEYKLVGVNVHSGTANAGHYWSYINTNRGIDEKEGDTSWIKTEADQWMEYNDSRVSDWEFKELKARTFGNEVKANQNAYFSSLGDSYGTSGYMLFYERRVKKPLMIIVAENEVEERKAKGEEVHYNEEKKEHYRMVEYRSSADGEHANDIYKRVFEDNMKFTFESDIYSTEFFDFILQILQSVADSDVDNSTKINGLKIGRKVGFEILARMMANPGVEHVSQVMIDILKSRPEITKPFVESMCDSDDCEVLWEVLLECQDKNAQKHLSRILQYALCQLKMEEREIALASEMQTATRTFTDSDGVEQTQQEQVPKAVCIRFLTQMTGLLAERAPKNWRKFDHFLQIFHSFMAFSAQDIDTGKEAHDPNSDAFKTGVELFFVYNMIRYLGDFILQENSPYNEPGQVRPQMGGAYGSPNFSAILKSIILMISDRAMMDKYPLDEKNQAIVAHKDILAKMIEPGEGSNADFSDVLVGMAFDNIKVSKKMAKAYLKGVNKNGIESVVKSLTQIRSFLKINDSLKMSRLEWIFGIPQVVSKPNFKSRQQQYGMELVDLISDEYCQFKSGCVKGITDAFLGQLFKAKGRMDSQCVVGLRTLIQMMLEDEVVARYVFQQPAPSLQFSRYTDWFFTYAEHLRAQTMNQVKTTATLLEYHKGRLESLENIMGMRERLEAMLQPMIDEQKTKLQSIGEGQFAGYSDHTLYPQVAEVIPSYPPCYIVGPTIFDSGRVIMTKEVDLAIVTLEEVSCEFMYSNPNSMFNLSVPEKMWRNPSNYQQMGYQSWKIAQLRAAATEGSSEAFTDDILIKSWQSDKSRAPTILKVMIKSKAAKMVRVGITLTVADNESKNVNFPITEIKENLFSNDSKQAFVFLKIDPSKETWGDIECQVSVKPGKTTQVNSYSSYGTQSGGNYYGGSYTSGGYSTATGGYTGSTTVTGMGTQTQTTSSYKPVGYEEGSTKISCANCNAECFVGEDFCGSCGGSVTEYDGV